MALVVGNSAYAAIGTLPNPGNDADDVAAALGRLGFDVTTVRDADRAGLNEALRLFARESAGADVSLVFYAGHGIEMDGVNYLVPVDARLARDTDVEYEALPLDRVLRATTGAGLLRIPGQTDHRFRPKPITDFASNRSVIPAETDHLQSGLRTRDNPAGVGSFLPLQEGQSWRTGGCPCGRFERCCGRTSPRR